MILCAGGELGRSGDQCERALRRDSRTGHARVIPARFLLHYEMALYNLIISEQ